MPVPPAKVSFPLPACKDARDGLENPGETSYVLWFYPSVDSRNAEGADISESVAVH